MHIKTEKMTGRVRNRPLKDYCGARFGRLVATALIERDERWNDHLWEFRCDCGAATQKRIKSVRSGHTSSCGCLQTESLVRRNEKHGLSRKHPREYRSWKDMRARCNSPGSADFADYGGRGIAVCKRWDDFAAFVQDMGPRPVGCTLDRINVNAGYEPENCRWADAKTQANNKRSNTIVGGQTLQQLSEAVGVGRGTIRYRLKAGYSVEQASNSEDLRRVRGPDRDRHG